MFSGIVEAVGTVVSLEAIGGGGRRLRLDSPWGQGEVHVSDSVAVDGVCLTVEEASGRRLSFSLSPETLRRTTLGRIRPGSPVNLERALTWGKPLGGHLVLGHVDGVGEVSWVRPAGQGKEMGFVVPNELLPFIALKGSVAINGVSLTVAGLRDREFWVALVPYTLQHTTLGRVAAGNMVNVEVDVLARYVHRQLAMLSAAPGLARPAASITPALLEELGYTAFFSQGGR